MTCSVLTHCELHRQTNKQTSLTLIKTTTTTRTVQSCWKHREMLASEWSNTHREHRVIQAKTAGSLYLNNCVWVFNELCGNMMYASMCLFNSVMFSNRPPVRGHSKQKGGNDDFCFYVRQCFLFTEQEMNWVQPLSVSCCLLFLSLLACAYVTASHTVHMWWASHLTCKGTDSVNDVRCFHQLTADDYYLFIFFKVTFHKKHPGWFLLNWWCCGNGHSVVSAH